MPTRPHSVLVALMCMALSSVGAQQAATTGSAKGAVAAPKCQLEDYTDAFTKQREVYSGPTTVYSEKLNLRRAALRGFHYDEDTHPRSSQIHLRVYATWKNGIREIGLQRMVWQASDYLEFQRSAEDPQIVFLLSNGEPIAVPLSAVGPSTTTKGWATQVEFGTVGDSAWSQLRMFPPTMLRIQYNGDENFIYTQDFTIEEQFRGGIPFVLKCIDDLELQKRP